MSERESALNTMLATDFVPSEISTSLRLRRLKVFLQNVSTAPTWTLARAPRSNGPWALYFVYTVSGEIFEQHLFTINRLKASGFLVLAVVGSGKIANSLPAGLEH